MGANNLTSEQPITFGVLSDPHITLPHTLRDYCFRSHFLEVGLAVLEQILAELVAQAVQFLLIPGDLTQDGELENHQWLADRLAHLPFPSYVIAGNHDLRVPHTTGQQLGLADFAQMYRGQGYQNTNQPYFSCEVAPNIRLIGLNTVWFAGETARVGLDAAQWVWLKDILTTYRHQEILVMVHYNVLEHIPDQASNPATKGYMLEGHQDLQDLLHRYGARWIFTGHSHMQDIAYKNGIYDITTGSLVSYPHPYRLCTLAAGKLTVRSFQVRELPQWPDLQAFSLARTQRLSDFHLLRLLTQPPLALERQVAEPLLPKLRNFWPKICAGDAQFDLPDLPPQVRAYFERFTDLPPGDNHAILPHI